MHGFSLSTLSRLAVNGPWKRELIRSRLGASIDVEIEWLGLASRLVEAFPGGARPREHAVAAFIGRDPAVRRLLRKFRHHSLGDTTALEPVMTPAIGAPQAWPIPAILSLDELAHRLGIDRAQLGWLTHPAAQHYDSQWIDKRSGDRRLLEKPRPLMKRVQRCILDRILSHIPPHPAAHGFRTGHSIRTFAEPHAGRRLLLRMDLREFFPSIGIARVIALFRNAGYPDPVSHALSRLCTTATPYEIAIQAPAWFSRQRLRESHLPQGAPTSPALSNLIAYRLDCRLSGLAESTGANYTRYADDLALSGGDPFRRRATGLIPLIGAIILEEGFENNMRKTRVMGRALRQRIAGVVVNAHPNTARPERDKLRAILHNCIQNGIASQNHGRHADFRSHLRGRIAHVGMLNPAQGERLRHLFDRIPE